MKAKWILEVEDLTVRRDHAIVLDHLSLSVARRTIHAIVGKNGAGKSTLLHAILGELEFTGSIRFRFDKSGAIAFVPQRLAVDRTLPVTVADFLALSRQTRPLFLGVSKSVRAAAERALDQVDLGGFADRLLGALSGGELQRVLLADALDPAPELLLLDEPTTGLDAPSLAKLEALLLYAREKLGTTILFVAHDLELVGKISDRITRMDRGKVETGRAEDMLEGAPA
jgi:zinc transport system ATP-binding protein